MSSTLRIGEFLVSKGVLNAEQAEQILKYSRARRLRFGDAGLELNLLSREKLIRVFGPSFAVDFFHLDPAYFPQATRNLLRPDQILRYGALPLGFKTVRRFLRAERKMLNVGLLNPARRDAIREIEAATRADGVRVFLILGDEFLRIVRDVYGLDEATLAAREPAGLDPTLAMYLDATPAEGSPS